MNSNSPSMQKLANPVNPPISEADTESAIISHENSQYKGLAGWLFLVILSLFINIGFGLYTIFKDIGLFMDGSIDQAAIYIPGINGLLVFELIATILLTSAAIYLIFLFFKTKREFPKFYVVFLITSLIFVIIEFAFVQGLSDQVKSVMSDTINNQTTVLGQAVWGSIIWGLYMFKSKRVKATFIN